MREDSEAALDRLLPRIHPRAPRDNLVRNVDELCLRYHTLGVASLLLDGHPRDFFLALGRAAENWRRLLVHLRTRGERLPPATSHTPLLGAVAASHWELARGIVMASATERQADIDEYEDDFDWALLLQQLIAPAERAPGRTEALITQLERSGADTYGERLEVARTLQGHEAQAFFDAFEQVLLAHEEQTEELASKSTTPFERFAPYRYLWLEGLALLRLGERAGFTREDRIRYCPPLARLRMHVPIDEDWLIPLAS
ncbi:hypothetical protein Q664_13060 [Archangium violaceum Cb vi76]|uniref:Uncharacterized protein n=2 Tax=Archangium violaceum TaxID=83451 RepID=A0A084SWE9_9BACT|nr:hypothetical protein Q664_13060 [Archangium violaceum Cb vi76]